MRGGSAGRGVRGVRGGCEGRVCGEGCEGRVCGEAVRGVRGGV